MSSRLAGARTRDAASAPTRIVGYDPGGNGCHGLAELRLETDSTARHCLRTMSTTEDVIRFIEDGPAISALGVDTLSCWSTGRSGWRPADRWLREQYPEVQLSVAPGNSLYGSMGLSGMAVLLAVRQCHAQALITETHPKVLYYHLTGQRYDYEKHSRTMNALLAEALGVPIQPSNDHEWDAALSAYAALQALWRNWTHDLLGLPTENGERIISPCADTHYFWPTPE